MSQPPQRHICLFLVISVAALTLYDMLKAVDRGMVIGEIALWEKRGGTRGRWRRQP